MEDVAHHWAPSVAIFAPLVGAVIMLLVPRRSEALHKWIALLTSLFVLAVMIDIAYYFDYDRSGTLQFIVDKNWIEAINARYILGVDGISLPLLLLTALIVPLC